MLRAADGVGVLRPGGVYLTGELLGGHILDPHANILIHEAARELDFSLDDIGEILAPREDGEAPCLYVTELVEKQLAAIDAKIIALNQLRCELAEIQQQAQSIPLDVIINKDCVCHLLENQAIT